MQADGQNIRNFITDNNEHGTQNIISKLKFIAKLKENEKIDLQSLQVITADYWPSRLYRTFIARGESREHTLEFIKEIIGEAFDLCTRYMTIKQEFYQHVCNSLVLALQESKIGLKNLCKTYKDDRMFTSQIESLITTLDVKTSDLTKHFDEIQSQIQI